ALRRSESPHAGATLVWSRTLRPVAPGGESRRESPLRAQARSHTGSVFLWERPRSRTRQAQEVDRRHHSGASKLIFTASVLRCAGPWYTASMLLPSGSSTKAA